MTPIRVHVTANGDGSRQVVVSCACLKVRRLYAAWEPLPEAIGQLRADHHRRAPSCPHPWLGSDQAPAQPDPHLDHHREGSTTR